MDDEGRGENAGGSIGDLASSHTAGRLSRFRGGTIRTMTIFKYAERLSKFILVESGKKLLNRAIAFAVLMPIYIAIMWLTLPHLIQGPDVLIWLVTGLLVLIALPIVYFLTKLSGRIDDAVSNRQNAADDEAD